MLLVMTVCLSLTLAQEPASSSPPTERTGPIIEGNSDEARALAEYNAIRSKTADTASAQWKLALWCEKAGLKPEALTHLGRVIELDPRRDLAWLKIGFKKHDGRWMKPERIVEEEELEKASKLWLARLKKWHKDIHGGKKQPEAQAALDAITDPSAVSAIYQEFGGGGPRDQEIAVQLLGQIDTPISSKTLAMLAIYGKSPNVRRIATETLRGRNPEVYLEVLVNLMKDLWKFEVRPVGGPGSPGILLVEGQRFNVKRFYALLHRPMFRPDPVT